MLPTHCIGKRPCQKVRWLAANLRAGCREHVSGYHMAVVAGVVFFVVRAPLALAPALAVVSRCAARLVLVGFPGGEQLERLVKAPHPAQLADMCSITSRWPKGTAKLLGKRKVEMLLASPSAPAH